MTFCTVADWSSCSGAPKRLSRIANDTRTLSLQLKLADVAVCPHDGSDLARSMEASIQQCREIANDIVQAVVRLQSLSTRYCNGEDVVSDGLIVSL